MKTLIYKNPQFFYEPKINKRNTYQNHISISESHTHLKPRSKMFLDLKLPESHHTHTLSLYHISQNHIKWL